MEHFSLIWTSWLWCQYFGHLCWLVSIPQTHLCIELHIWAYLSSLLHGITLLVLGHPHIAFQAKWCSLVFLSSPRQVWIMLIPPVVSYPWSFVAASAFFLARIQPFEVCPLMSSPSLPAHALMLSLHIAPSFIRSLILQIQDLHVYSVCVRFLTVTAFLFWNLINYSDFVIIWIINVNLDKIYDMHYWYLF